MTKKEYTTPTFQVMRLPNHLDIITFSEVRTTGISENDVELGYDKTGGVPVDAW